MTIAAFWGKSVGFTDYFNSVFIETPDGRARVIGSTTFDYLYYRLDPFTAALKEDCIEYVTNEPIGEAHDFPSWYFDAVDDGVIFEEHGTVIFYEENGDVAMSPGSVILRNFEGRLRYMEFNDFIKYYDVQGE